MLHNLQAQSLPGDNAAKAVPEEALKLRIKMLRKFSPFRVVSFCYGSLIVAIAIWAWYIDVRLLHSEREHLLPDILLAIAGMPSSLTADWVYEAWPKSFVGGVQTA